MIDLPILDCNRCGECCKQGGICGFRGESWTLRKMPLEFSGTCELLTINNECSVMLAVIAQDGNDSVLKKYMGVKGICDFPDLRLTNEIITH